VPPLGPTEVIATEDRNTIHHVLHTRSEPSVPVGTHGLCATSHQRGVALGRPADAFEVITLPGG